MWLPREKLDLKQVWFAGAHSDAAGSHKPDRDGSLLADIALGWIIREAKAAGLTLETHLEEGLKPNSFATLHSSRRHFYRVKTMFYRPIDHGKGKVITHRLVRERWEKDANYRPENLVHFVKKTDGWTF